jgi:hypothetical protein
VIIRWLPSLSYEEIALIDRYYRQHQEELDEYENDVQAYRAEQIRLQRVRFPERKGSRHERLAELKQLLHKRRPETDGEGTRG